MTRQELYKEVKKLGVADAIKSAFGDNFTRVSNKNLESFLNKFKEKQKKTVSKSKVAEKEPKGISNAIVSLLSILQARKIITAKEAEEVAKLL